MLLNATTHTIVPLAPAAPVQPLPSQSAAPHHQRQLRPRRRRDRADSGDDEEDGFDKQMSTNLHRQQQQRIRSSSFDETGKAFGKSSSISHSLLSKEVTRKNIIDDRYQNKHSLLTTFLLHLNSILPEYCHHLASTSEDTAQAIANASKAIDVLERGVRTVSVTSTTVGFGDHVISNNDNIIHALSTSPETYSSPSSPLLSTQSPTTIYSKWSTSPIKQKWLASPPQTTSTNGGFIVGNGTIKWNNTVKSEWGKFISPFMNLVGAECLYSRMEHVLDSDQCITETKLKAKGKGGGGESTSSSSNLLDQKRLMSNSLSSAQNDDVNMDARKVGSRRLIAMYRQIREDLVIVGEYLCDSVLGARVTNKRELDSTNAASSSLSKMLTMPLPPLPLVMDNLSSSPSDSQDGSIVSKIRNTGTTYCERRELAAISFRETLDALVHFIDARCTLIRIHAVLCYPEKSKHNHASATLGDAHHAPNDNSTEGRKWVALAEQCQQVLNSLTLIGEKNGHTCIPQRAVNNIKVEVKCLALALTALDKMLSRDLFYCVLSIRKLSVLLENLPYKKSYIPIMYIQSSLPMLLARMRIFFNEASPNPQPTRLNNTTFKQAAAKSNKTDFIELFHEFARNNSSGIPLAVVLAERAHEVGEENPRSHDIASNVYSDNEWKPLYVSSSINGSTGEATKTQRTNWPMNNWTLIQELLHKHYSSIMTSEPAKYSIESILQADNRVVNLSPNRKECCHISSVSHSLCLLIIQGVGSSKWKNSSDSAIHRFLRITSPKLNEENILSLEVVIQLKSKINITQNSYRTHGSDRTVSLWTESGWSATVGKEVLKSLGLRKKHSPILAPLKSPYVKRQIRSFGRQRQKKNANRSHIDFFLGPEIGRLL